MSVYGITGVELGEDQRISRVVARQFEIPEDAWIGHKQILEAHQVADMILSGDMFFASFNASPNKIDGTKFRYVAYPGGSEGIELEEDGHGRTIKDITQHVAW